MTQSSKLMKGWNTCISLERLTKWFLGAFGLQWAKVKQKTGSRSQTKVLWMRWGLTQEVTHKPRPTGRNESVGGFQLETNVDWKSDLTFSNKHLRTDKINNDLFEKLSGETISSSMSWLGSRMIIQNTSAAVPPLNGSKQKTNKRLEIVA